jgi:hypothetical protein
LPLVFESQRPVAIVFDFVEPIAFWQLLDWKSIHRFNEREAALNAYFH